MYSKQRYFEFNSHGYYGLVVAKDEDKAYEVYLRNVGGESIEEVKAEGKPDEISITEALGKVIKADVKNGSEGDKAQSISDYYGEFLDCVNCALLIDGSLI